MKELMMRERKVTILSLHMWIIEKWGFISRYIARSRRLVSENNLFSTDPLTSRAESFSRLGNRQLAPIGH